MAGAPAHCARVKPEQTQRLAAYGVLVESGRLLLCRLNLPNEWDGHWTLPGGGLEFGEHPEQGLRREFREETNLQVSARRLLGIDSRIYTEDPNHHHHALRFIYSVSRVGGSLTSEEVGTTDLAKFFTRDEVEGLPVVPLVRTALKWSR